MRENEERMMHSEELMRKLRNTDKSGCYVRPCTHNVHAHTLHSHQNRPQHTGISDSWQSGLPHVFPANILDFELNETQHDINELGENLAENSQPEYNNENLVDQDLDSDTTDDLCVLM